MKFTVVWGRDAEADLALLWLNANSRIRKAIQIAADAFDSVLSTNAQFVGQLRTGNMRTLRISPLIIDFEVVVDDRLVRVLGVRFDPEFGSANGRPL